MAENRQELNRNLAQMLKGLAARDWELGKV